MKRITVIPKHIGRINRKKRKMLFSHETQLNENFLFINTGFRVRVSADWTGYCTVSVEHSYQEKQYPLKRRFLKSVPDYNRFSFERLLIK